MMVMRHTAAPTTTISIRTLTRMPATLVSHPVLCTTRGAALCRRRRSSVRDKQSTLGRQSHLSQSQKRRHALSHTPPLRVP